MKLSFTYQQLCEIFELPLNEKREEIIHYISTDTRTLYNGKNTLFFALKGKRNGADFIQKAYDLGCRNFVVQQNKNLNLPKDVCCYRVENVLFALQKLAQKHREIWQGKILVVAGGLGKTTTKEWLYHAIQNHFKVLRSPKSYNSQLGVALSLLELNEQFNFAIIEAGFSKKDETLRLSQMIQADYGILTSQEIRNTNLSPKEQVHALAELFQNVQWLVTKKAVFDVQIPQITWNDNENIHHQINAEKTSILFKNTPIEIPFSNSSSIENATNILLAAEKLGVDLESIKKSLEIITPLALRMEFLKGKNNNAIINDTYNIDLGSTKQAAHYFASYPEKERKIAVIALLEEDLDKKLDVQTILSGVEVIFCHPKGANGLLSFEATEKILDKTNNSVILFKGSHGAGLQHIVAQQIQKKHTTFLAIDRKALRHNLLFYRQQVNENTAVLVMIKAASYGSGSVEMAKFLVEEGVGYLGVAYADEGVELRKAGIQVPILVMNAEPEAFRDIVKYDLQPAIFSIQQLDEFTHILIEGNKQNYPIHVKLETGMNRLGFTERQLNELIAFVKAQPEIKIESIYSHFAMSDSSNRTFTLQQTVYFKAMSQQILEAFSYPIKRHICNSSGITNYPEAHFDMVRLGIGLFGVENPTDLHQAISFKTHISSIKTIQKGESVGYNRTYIAQKEETIAVIPVGYADGLRRSMGNGKTYVLVGGRKAPIIGNVCMDMCFINVSEMNVSVGDEVELFGIHLSIKQWAKWLETITYEVLTSIAPRVKRLWIE